MNRRSEGEEWAAAELRRLRKQRFTPSAWRRFIACSFERAAQTRAARPSLARQARRWSGVGAAAGVGVCAVDPRLRRHTLGFASWWLLVTAMLDWHLGMVEGPAAEARDQLSAADAVTLARLWVVPFLAGTDEPCGFSVMTLGAALTDALDGPLARQLGPTRLGRDLDRAADVLVMLAAARSARREGWLTGLVARLLLLRGTLPVAVVAGYYFLRGAAPPVDELGSFRRFAPVLITGLTVAPAAPRVGNTLVALAAGGPLAAGARRPFLDRAVQRRHGHADRVAAYSQTGSSAGRELGRGPARQGARESGGVIAQARPARVRAMISARQAMARGGGRWILLTR